MVAFDPPHVGHLEYLKAAAALGPLIVRIAPDRDIECKGRHPYQTAEERARFFEALSFVSEVCHYDTLAEAVRTLKPAYLVKGWEWHGHIPAEVLAACREAKTSLVYSATTGLSATDRLEGVRPEHRFAHAI